MHARWPLTPGVRRRPPAAPSTFDRYWHAVPRPIYCLAVLLPLAAVYEIGIRIAADGWPPRTLLAHSVLQGLLGWIGATGRWLPAAALVVTLLVWQTRTGSRWRVRPWIVGGMLVEGLILAAPLLVLKKMLLPDADRSADPAVGLLLGLGAGVYEELLFRFYLIALLSGLCIGLLRLPAHIAAPLIVIADAAIFAACHFRPIGADAWTWASAIVRTAAGGYLAMVYIRRGLGVAAISHAAHNALSALL
jgi:hypothetical protein